MDKAETDLKLRFIELLFILAIFLTGIEQIKSPSNDIIFLTAFFLLSGLLYYILIMMDITGKIFRLVIILTSVSFSGIMAIFLGIAFSSLSYAILYYLMITLLLIITLSEKKQFKIWAQKYFSKKT